MFSLLNIHSIEINFTTGLFWASFKYRWQYRTTLYTQKLFHSQAFRLGVDHPSLVSGADGEPPLPQTPWVFLDNAAILYINRSLSWPIARVPTTYSDQSGNYPRTPETSPTRMNLSSSSHRQTDTAIHILHEKFVLNVEVDAMHDILDGLARCDITFGLDYFIYNQKYFTIEDLTVRMRRIDYGSDANIKLFKYINLT